MLNPGFSQQLEDAYGNAYIVPDGLTEAIVGANSEHAAGPELRTQQAYGDEVWFRLRELGLRSLPWSELHVLDACCGSGFLAYHLLRRTSFRSLTLLDVSPCELESAERLIRETAADLDQVTAVCADLASADRGHFDVVVGNSFLHHFPNVPDVLETIFQLIRPGGLFIGLHEPTPAALPLEAGSLRHLVGYLAGSQRYLRRARYGGPGPVRAGTTDVWMFDPASLRQLLSQQGFTGVRLVPRYLLRPSVVAMGKLHLGPTKPRLSRFESGLLMTAVRADAVLRKLLPAAAFGGVSFVARRPG